MMVGQNITITYLITFTTKTETGAPSSNSRRPDPL